MREELNVGTEVNDVESLEVLHPHLEPIPLKKYSNGDVELILGQDGFHCIRLLEYFETDRRNTPIVVRLPLGWVLSGPLPWTSSLISTCFKTVTQRATDAKLATKAVVGMTSSHTGLINKSNCAPQSSREQMKPF